MDSIVPFLISHLSMAPLAIFGLFMMAGMFIPISEDLLILTSGFVAGTFEDAIIWKFYLAVLFGAFLSDWIPYWVGRKLGGHLLEIKWVAKRIKPEKVESVKGYYKRYGILTLLFGRFIPFGVRNCLLLTAGITKMPFSRFLLADSLACSFGISLLFSLSFFLGKNSTHLFKHIFYIEIALFSLFLLLLITFICYKVWKSKKLVAKSDNENS